MERLTLEQVAAAAAKPDIRTEEVELPGLGGTVMVREMTGSLRNRFENIGARIRMGNNVAKDLAQMHAEILATCVLSDNGGGPLLPLETAKQLIANRPREAFLLRDKVIGLSAVTQRDAEELAEGFGFGPSDSSTSDSPDTSD